MAEPCFKGGQVHEKAEGDTEKRESELKYKEKWLLRDQEGGTDLKY